MAVVLILVLVSQQSLCVADVNRFPDYSDVAGGRYYLACAAGHISLINVSVWYCTVLSGVSSNEGTYVTL